MVKYKGVCGRHEGILTDAVRFIVAQTAKKKKKEPN